MIVNLETRLQAFDPEEKQEAHSPRHSIKRSGKVGTIVRVRHESRPIIRNPDAVIDKQGGDQLTLKHLATFQDPDKENNSPQMVRESVHSSQNQ